jgi:signal transduction histidine kinase
MKLAGTRAVIVAMVGVVLAFLGSIAYSTYLSSTIGREAAGIRFSAVPSAALLLRTRGALSHVHMLMDGLPSRPTSAQLDEIDRAVKRATASFQEFVRLPFYPGEWQAAQEVSHRLIELDRAAVSSRGLDGREVRARVGAALRQADQGIERLMLLNIDWASLHANKILRGWRRSMYVEFTLDAICVGLAVLATLLAVRAARRETQLLEERATELDQFAGRLAHDVLSPLGTVAAAMPLLERRAGGDAQARQIAARVLASVRRVHSLVDALLEFARSGAHPEPDARCDPVPVLDGVLADLKEDVERAQVTITVEAFVIRAVHARPGVLASLLSNLLQNAIKYMGEAPTRMVRVRAMPSGDRVRFEVEDTGPGVPAELQRAVFAPYFRVGSSDQAGVGLGLATVKRLAEAHGGAAGVRSGPSGGATFWFELEAPRR